MSAHDPHTTPTGALIRFGGLIRLNSVYVNRAELVDPHRNSADNVNTA